MREEEVLRYLEREGRATLGMIAKGTGIRKSYVETLLYKLVAEGKVKKVGYGLYEVVKWWEM